MGIETHSHLQGSLTGHEGAVLQVKWTPDGSYCLSGGADKSVRLWNPHTRQEIKAFTQVHNQDVTCLATFKDNSQFFSAGGDKTAFLWDVTKGIPKRKFTGHDRRIHACMLSRTEEMVLTGSADKTIRCWDLRSGPGRPTQILKHATDTILSLAIVSDTEFAAGSADGTIRTYDIRRGVVLNDELLSPVSCLGVSNDGNCVLAAVLDSTIALLEKESGEVLATYEGHVNTKYQLGASLDPNDSYVAGGSEDGRILYWDLVSGKVLKTVNTHEKKPIYGLQFHEKKDALLTCGGDGAIKIWGTIPRHVLAG